MAPLISQLAIHTTTQNIPLMSATAAAGNRQDHPIGPHVRAVQNGRATTTTGFGIDPLALQVVSASF